MLNNNKRGKSRYTGDYSLKDCYNSYKNSCKEQDIKYVTYTVYSKVYKSFIKSVILEMIQDAGDFKLPYRLGELSIRKRKIEKKLDDNGDIVHVNRPIDWGSTNKMWIEKYGTSDIKKLKQIKNKKLIRYDNKHTNGYTFKVYWDKYLCVVKNRSKYAFKPCRDFVRSISKIQKEQKTDYYEIK